MARQRGNELDDAGHGEGHDGVRGEGRDGVRDEGPGSARDERAGTRSGAPTREGGDTPPGGAPVFPESVRRLIALGLSGMFSTQESLRQAVGDALPREWVDFAAEQSERTRSDFLERLAGELARSIETIDLARVMQQALEGQTLEVHARIRMLPDDEASGEGGGLRIRMTRDDES